MAFYLHTAEVDKARSVARKALTTISFRLVVKNFCMCIYKYMYHVYMKYLQYVNVHVYVHKIPLVCTCTNIHVYMKYLQHVNIHIHVHVHEIPTVCTCICHQMYSTCVHELPPACTCTLI